MNLKNSKLYKLNVKTFYCSFKMFLLKNISFEHKFNYFKCSLSAYLKRKKSWGKPILLTIEPTNVCDQKCPICETGNGTLDRKPQFMSFDEFKQIIDQFDNTLNRIFFYFMGEPFLNKDAYRMIKYARQKNIYVETCTNGNFIIPEDLINSDVSEVNFQISGMTQEIHTKYRVGGKLEDVLNKIQETVEIRNKKKSKTKIIVGYILMKHNEDQLNDFVDFCKKTGVDSYNIIGTTARNIKQAFEYMPSNPKYRIFNEEFLEKGKLIPKIRPDNYCGWLYGGINIMVNGDVVSCCRDPKAKNVLGNVYSENLYTIWNNDKYQQLRKLVNSKSNELDLCRVCLGENIPVLKK